MIIASVPIAAAVVGLLLWVLASGKASEAGKIVFAAAVLVALFAVEHSGSVRIP
jgi:hypothetical protein